MVVDSSRKASELGESLVLLYMLLAWLKVGPRHDGGWF